MATTSVAGPSAAVYTASSPDGSDFRRSGFVLPSSSRSLLSPYEDQDGEAGVAFSPHSRLDAPARSLPSSSSSASPRSQQRRRNNVAAGSAQANRSTNLNGRSLAADSSPLSPDGSSRPETSHNAGQEDDTSPGVSLHSSLSPSLPQTAFPLHRHQRASRAPASLTSANLAVAAQTSNVAAADQQSVGFTAASEYAPSASNLPSSATPNDSKAASSTSDATATATSPSASIASLPKAPAWGAPKNWATLASGTGSSQSLAYTATPSSSSAVATPITSTAGSPDTSRQPSINGSVQLSSSQHLASRRSTSRPPVLTERQARLQTLEARLRAAESVFAAPLTAPRGMINNGNFCFANAILQVLVYCAPFVNLFTLIGTEVPPDFSNSTPLMEAIIQFLREFHPVPSGAPPSAQALDASEPFVPDFVYDAMRLTKRFDTMRRGHQEDAEEFLGFLLDTLHEELLSALRKLEARAGALVASVAADENSVAGEDDVGAEERVLRRPVSPGEEGWMEVGTKGRVAHTRTTATSDSPITRIFGGKLRSVLRTPGMKDSVTLEPYQPLQLDIAPAHIHTLSDALKSLVEPEIIPGVWSPARGAQVDATKTVCIESLPPVLVLHLKRFVYEAGEVRKNSKELEFSTQLEVAEEVVALSRRAEAKRRYRLFGVVYHHGRFASGGHYTVDVLRQDGNEWLHIDDVLWSACPPPGGSSSSVSASSTAPQAASRTHEGVPYLLFYAREDSLPQSALAQVDGDSSKEATSKPVVNGIRHQRTVSAGDGKQRQGNGSATPRVQAQSPATNTGAPLPEAAAAPKKRVVPGAVPPPAKFAVKKQPKQDRAPVNGNAIVH
ncbi:ubiquitin-specific protease [Ceraceosorus bombacis]|uniref:Ubiquitin carboxyl-terminal hydrolase n=1 Tax=Ceraceosorus bombacis TaxID=401625 RepID=A0A0N7L9Y9_9BASI|nr:ubiquitin-specific protease [Ceraceosorus bombacis]